MHEVATSEENTGFAGSNFLLFAFALFVAFYSLIEVVRGFLPVRVNTTELGLPLLSAQQVNSEEYGALGSGVFTDTELSYEQLLAIGDVIGSVKTGLSEDEIAAVSNWATYSPSLGGAAESPRGCPICLEGFLQDERLMLLACKCHWFHASCVTQWLLTKPSCPCCRFSFV